MSPLVVTYLVVKLALGRYSLAIVLFYEVAYKIGTVLFLDVCSCISTCPQSVGKLALYLHHT